MEELPSGCVFALAGLVVAILILFVGSLVASLAPDLVAPWGTSGTIWLLAILLAVPVFVAAGLLLSLWRRFTSRKST